MFAVRRVPAVPHHVVVTALRQLLELNKLLVCEELHSPPCQEAPQLNQCCGSGLGLLDPDPVVRGTDPGLSIIKQK